VGQTLGGRYRIGEVIGSGGMGTVFRAEHVIIERPVAVKVLLPSCCRAQNVRERFYREARITNRIQHPNVLEVLDLGETEGGLLYLVMDFLHGETLAKRLSRATVAVDTLLDIVSEICDGLAAAHELGIIHRDITPSNVFLVARLRNSPSR